MIDCDVADLPAEVADRHLALGGEDHVAVPLPGVAGLHLGEAPVVEVGQRVHRPLGRGEVLGAGAGHRERVRRLAAACPRARPLRRSRRSPRGCRPSSRCRPRARGRRRAAAAAAPTAATAASSLTRSTAVAPGRRPPGRVQGQVMSNRCGPRGSAGRCRSSALLGTLAAGHLAQPAAEPTAGWRPRSAVRDPVRAARLGAGAPRAALPLEPLLGGHHRRARDRGGLLVEVDVRLAELVEGVVHLGGVAARVGELVELVPGRPR